MINQPITKSRITFFDQSLSEVKKVISGFCDLRVDQVDEKMLLSKNQYTLNQFFLVQRMGCTIIQTLKKIIHILEISWFELQFLFHSEYECPGTIGIKKNIEGIDITVDTNKYENLLKENEILKETIKNILELR